MKKIILVLVLAGLVLMFGSVVWAQVTAEGGTPPEAVEVTTPPNLPLSGEEVQTEQVLEEEEPVPLVEHLEIIDEGTVILEIDAPLPEAGSISVTDSTGESQDVDARSVLGFLYAVDQSENAFSISQLIYYQSFGAFYLKCISFAGTEKCDNWQYKVDGEMPSVGMDSNILSGGEEIEIFYDASFWGSDSDEAEDPEPEISDDDEAEVSPSPEPEEETQRTSSSGSRSRQKTTEATTIPPETEIAQAPLPAEILPAEVPVPKAPTSVTPVVKKQAKIELVAEKPDLPASNPLPAATGESQASINWPMIAGSLFLFGVVVYFGRRIFAQK